MRGVRALAAGAAFLLGAGLLPGGPAARAAAEPSPVRIGVLLDSGAPDADVLVGGFHAALRANPPDGRPVVLVERAATERESDVRASLAELALEGAEVVVAIGESPARFAAEAVRDRPVVTVSADPDAPPSGRVRRVSWSADPARMADLLRRLAPGADRIGVVGPATDAIVGSLAPKGEAGPALTVDRLVWSDATGSWGPGLAVADLVFASPGTPASQVTDLARRLAGQGIPLVGSRASHLDAGAAIVLRPLPADVGALAAAAAADALAGNGDPSRIVRPRRIFREVHLANARRLGFLVPLAVLASSDRTVAPPPERR